VFDQKVKIIISSQRESW